MMEPDEVGVCLICEKHQEDFLRYCPSTVGPARFLNFAADVVAIRCKETIMSAISVGYLKEDDSFCCVLPDEAWDLVVSCVVDEYLKHVSIKECGCA